MTEATTVDQRTYDERESDFLARAGEHADLYALQKGDALDLGREFLGMMPQLIRETAESLGAQRTSRASEERIAEFDQMMEESDNGDNRRLKSFLIRHGIFNNRQAIQHPSERMRALGKACYAIGYSMPAISAR